jgi:hypothetical protein
LFGIILIASSTANLTPVLFFFRQYGTRPRAGDARCIDPCVFTELTEDESRNCPAGGFPRDRLIVARGDITLYALETALVIVTFGFLEVICALEES